MSEVYTANLTLIPEVPALILMYLVRWSICTPPFQIIRPPNVVSTILIYSKILGATLAVQALLGNADICMLYIDALTVIL